MGGLSIWHWVIILVVVVLLFGAKKLPEAARGVGRSLRILKSEVNAMNEDKKETGAQAAAQAAPVALDKPAVEPIPAPEPITPPADQR